MTPATSRLESAVARCPHLQLTDSQGVFPDRVQDAALAMVTVRNDRCRATVAIQGAQLLTFHTTAGDSLLWLSPKAIFQPGKAIRGGIPLCLPWFGPHPSDASKPQHGFARNRDWALLDAEAVDSGTTRLIWELSYPSSSPLESLFDGQFSAQLIMTLTDRISLELTVHNTGKVAFPLSWAWHSYHPVADLAVAEVSGLDQCDYWDNAKTAQVKPSQKQHQTGNVRFSGEVDRVYVNVPPTQQLHCGPDTLTATAENCPAAILWNPGATLAANMADVGQHYEEFVCLERGNAAEHTQRLSPGDVHRARLDIRLQVQAPR